ncbi:MAG: PAS domain S-box protein [Methylobacter sp.]|nr:MAG: PAS domain S-box protein [Methylobacter sp.]
MKATHKIAVSFAGVALLVALGGLASFWSFRQIEDAAKMRQHSHNVIDGANNLLSALKDAETSERSFLLSGDETHLEPYWAIRNSIKGDLEKLQHITALSAAKEYLDTLTLMLDAKLAYMAHNIELRRNYDMSTVLADLHSGLGEHLMDSFHAEISSFVQLEESALIQREAVFKSNLRYLFIIIVIVGLLTLLLVVSLAYSIYRETQHLLDILKQMNKQLHQANVILQDSEEKLLVTLNSIGDAVIVTDVNGYVTSLNPSAEQLTGWMQNEAAGRPVDEVFHIINQDTRQVSVIPVMEALAHDTTQGLINHTLLIARDGSECAIADSCAPIHDRDAQVAGAVLVFRDVTKEYAAQQILRDNTELTQTMLNTMVDGIIIFKAHGAILETVNPAAERMFGYTGAELIGQKASLLIPELNWDQRHDSLDYYTASNKAHAVGLRKDGSTFSVEMAVSEMWLGGQRYFTCILRDITLRKRVETERAQLYQRLSDQQFYTRSLIESNIDAIMTTDPSGIITDVNKQMEALTCCTRDELIGAPFKNYFTEPGLAEAGIKRVLIEKKVNDYELTVHGRDGKETVVSYNAATFYDRDRKLQGVFVAARDVTHSKRQDQALKEKNIELENAKAVAEKASLAKSVFLSNMSHELRTPLNAILGFAQLLEAGVPPPTATQVIRLNQIIKAGWYLLDLINEILDLSVIESGKLVLLQESVPMSEVMRECRSMVEAQAQKRNIQINFFPFDSTWFANADRTRVKQVVINLLSNAIKYNREYGTVEVKCSSTPQRIRISIKDSGEGLSPEKLEQLFQPFNRLGQETGAEEGTGIGLVVTKQLVELMGGSISVTSTVGVGSEFCIELIRDVTQQHAAGDNAIATEFATQVQRNTELRTLLYVEDNAANLMLVEQIIEDLPDLRMLSAGNGYHGIALARAHLPNVILMDINLPGISGIEAMNILRKDPGTRYIPVIALSANAMLRDIEKGLEVGFFRYLTKPIKINEFMKAVNDALELSEMGLTKANETGSDAAQCL